MKKNTSKKRKQKKIKVVYKKLGRSKVLGFSYQDENLVEIEETLKGKILMKVLIHELVHQSFPNASESQVLKAERIIGNTLWEQNYRKVEG